MMLKFKRVRNHVIHTKGRGFISPLNEYYLLKKYSVGRRSLSDFAQTVQMNTFKAHHTVAGNYPHAYS